MTIEVAETSRRYRMLYLYRSPWWTLVGMFTSPSWVAVGYTLQFLDEPVKLVDIARPSEYFQRYPLNRPTSTLKEWDWLWLIPSLYTLYTWCQTPPFSGSHNMWLHPLQHFFWRWVNHSEPSPSHEWNSPIVEYSIHPYSSTISHGLSSGPQNHPVDPVLKPWSSRVTSQKREIYGNMVEISMDFSMNFTYEMMLEILNLMETN